MQVGHAAADGRERVGKGDRLAVAGFGEVQQPSGVQGGGELLACPFCVNSRTTAMPPPPLPDANNTSGNGPRPAGVRSPIGA